MENDDIDKLFLNMFNKRAIECGIKKRPFTNLKDCLFCYTKAQLTQIAHKHGVHVRKSEKKDSIIGILEETLKTNIVRDFLYMGCQQRELLSILASGDKVDPSRTGVASSLDAIGYVYIFYYKDKITYVFPKELAGEFLVSLENCNEDRLKRNQEIDQYIKALLNLYGVLNVEQWLEVWNKYHNEKMEKDEIIKYLDIFDRLQVHYQYWWDGPYIVTDYLEEEDYRILLEETTGREYYIPTKEEIDYFAEHEVDDDNIYCKRVKSYLENKKQLNEDRLDDLMISITNGCTLDEPFQQVIDAVNKIGLSFDSLDDLNHFVKLYTDLSNHTRKWNLRGYQPDELFQRENLRPIPKNNNVIQFPKRTQVINKKK